MPTTQLSNEIYTVEKSLLSVSENNKKQNSRNLYIKSNCYIIRNKLPTNMKNLIGLISDLAVLVKTRSKSPKYVV